MMTWREAKEYMALDPANRVRRPSWDEGAYWTRDESGRLFDETVTRVRVGQVLTEGPNDDWEQVS
jgi:hypothetical protein